MWSVIHCRINHVMASPSILINLNPEDLHLRLLHDPFIVSLDWCDGSCNTFTDLSNKVCVINKT